MIEKKISEIVSENLTWSNYNVPQIAIILAELKDISLTKQFFSLLEKLPFRPLRKESSNDSTAINAYAICLDLSEEDGYEWFWNSYLDPVHPMKHYEANLAAEILSHYLVTKEFTIAPNQIERLTNLITPNLLLETTFCYTLLPVIATISRENLSEKQYFSLIASNLLRNTILTEKSKEILRIESISSQSAVLNALENMCSQRESTSIDAALFWTEINTGSTLSKAVLRTILGSITEETFFEYKNVLVNVLNEQNLKSYLRYCCVSNNDIAKHAALYLFLDGETNFKLLGSNLVNSIAWLDSKKTSLTEKIYQFVKNQNTSGMEALAKNLPIDNQLGIPPSFWAIFLPALQVSDTIYEQEFLQSVENLSLFILTRYPELRIAFTNLFKEKIAYKDMVHGLLLGLDNRSRYLSASLLLSLYPESQYDALEIVISGLSHDSEMDEWRTFILELKYSHESLTQLHKNLDIFTDESKIFALTLLSRNEYPLSKDKIDTLIDGLLSHGYFNDKAGYGFDAKFHVTLSQKKYKNVLVEYLICGDLEKAKRSASILNDYHWNELDDSSKMSVNIINSEDNDRYLFKITTKDTTQLIEEETYKILEKEADQFEKQYNRQSLLWLFCMALKTKCGLRTFFKAVVQNVDSDFRSELDYHYEWLLNIKKCHPELQVEISAGIQDLLLLPGIEENESDLFAWLKLIENEFSPESNINYSLLEHRYPRTEKEVFIALHYRGLYHFNEHVTDRRRFYPVFFDGETKIFKEVDNDEIEPYLLDLKNIPEKLNDKIESVIIFGTFNQAELDNFQSKGPLGAYFATVIKFSRQLNVDVSLFSNILTITDGNIDNLKILRFHKSVIYQIYKVLISHDAYTKTFIDALAVELESENPKNYLETFIQLLVLGHLFKDENIIKLLKEMDQNTYQLTPDRLGLISSYLVNQISEESTKQYIEIIKQILLKSKNHFEKNKAEINRHLLTWVLSLVLLNYEKIVSDESRAGFLLGLQACFLEKNSLRRRNKLDKENIFFTGGELLESSDELLQKVDPSLIREIVEYGTKTNIPEIRSVSFLLMSLNGN